MFIGMADTTPPISSSLVNCNAFVCDSSNPVLSLSSKAEERAGKAEAMPIGMAEPSAGGWGGDFWSSHC